MSIKRRCINENTSTQFLETIAVLPTLNAETVDKPLVKSTSKISNVMDAVAPIKTKWRKTKLQIHYELHRQSL